MKTWTVNYWLELSIDWFYWYRRRSLHKYNYQIHNRRVLTHNLFQTASIDRSAQVFVQPARCNIAEDPELYGRHLRAAQSASGWRTTVTTQSVPANNQCRGPISNADLVESRKSARSWSYRQLSTLNLIYHLNIISTNALNKIIEYKTIYHANY